MATKHCLDVDESPQVANKLGFWTGHAAISLPCSNCASASLGCAYDTRTWSPVMMTPRPDTMPQPLKCSYVCAGRPGCFGQVPYVMDAHAHPMIVVSRDAGFDLKDLQRVGMEDRHGVGRGWVVLPVQRAIHVMTQRFVHTLEPCNPEAHLFFLLRLLVCTYSCGRSRENVIELLPCFYVCGT